MKYQFSPAARSEFIDAVDYYELQQSGLGKAFSEEVYATIERTLQYPHGWTQLDNVFHRCLTKRFPYGIIYSIEDGTISITALMNLHRKPNYWKS